MVKPLRSLEKHVAILAATGASFHEYLANGYFDGASALTASPVGAVCLTVSLDIPAQRPVWFQKSCAM
jgi:hypothetical protein